MSNPKSKRLPFNNRFSVSIPIFLTSHKLSIIFFWLFFVSTSCFFRIFVEDLVKPVKKSRRLFSNFLIVFFFIFKSLTFTIPFFLKSKFFIPPNEDIYWSCFPTGLFKLLISISHDFSAKSVLLIFFELWYHHRRSPSLHQRAGYWPI